jgi:glucose/mannose-6-phosphate isomerase
MIKGIMNHNNQNFLDDLDKIHQIDESNVLGSIEQLQDQVKQTSQELEELEFPIENEIQNVIVAGMGGSALGADIVRNLYKNELKVPFDICRDYNLPSYVNKNTLVILSSYSGTTEETLSCAKQAKDKKAEIIVLSAGGDLINFANKHHFPFFQIKPDYNPSSQPRMALGYSIFALIGIIRKLKLIDFKAEQINDILIAIRDMNKKCSVNLSTKKNIAKMLAFNLVEKRPILVGAEFLEGILHVAANQLNENAKIFADYKIIPEINHHLLEGLQFPKSNKNNHLFIFIKSVFLNEKNQLRMKFTREVIEKEQIDNLEIKLEAYSKITQVFECLTLFSYTSLYLSILEGINPSLIPNVDWFKSQLKKLS